MALTLHVEIDAETGKLKGAKGELQRFGKLADNARRRSGRAFGRLRTIFQTPTRFEEIANQSFRSPMERNDQFLIK